MRKKDAGGVPGQINLADMGVIPVLPKLNGLLPVGAEIGRVILGECYTATVTGIEGLPRYPFYRTDKGCYSYEEGLRDIEELKREAEEARKNYTTIEPRGLFKRITVEYMPRECDGRVLTAQLGIYGTMLFWKESCTYSFLEPYDDLGKLRKEYERHLRNILEVDGKRGYSFLADELPIERLYWSKSKYLYASPRYVMDHL